MARPILTADRPLAGHERTLGSVRVTAFADLAVVAVALPLGGEAEAARAIAATCGAELPAPGRYATGSAGEFVIRTGPDQGLIQFRHAGPDAGGVIAARLGRAAYVADQSDAWAGLSVEGTGVRAALERICPLDLHADAFAANAAQRTVMDHLGVIILRTGPDAFLLLSASSSAAAFLHAVECSAANVA